MEVTAQGMPYAEFKDNEYIESLVSELRANGTNVVVGSLDILRKGWEEILSGISCSVPIVA